MSAPVYFDANATTALDPRVLDAMLPHLQGASGFGNASSRHGFGRAARKAIDDARQQVAVAVGAHPTEVVFNSGGSESNNQFLKGAAACLKPGSVAPVVAISAIEHPCVREAARDLLRSAPHRGWSLHEIAVDHQGRIDAGDYGALIGRLAEALLTSHSLLDLVDGRDVGAATIAEAEALSAQAAIMRWFTRRHPGVGGISAAAADALEAAASARVIELVPGTIEGPAADRCADCGRESAPWFSRCDQCQAKVNAGGSIPAPSGGVALGAARSTAAPAPPPARRSAKPSPNRAARRKRAKS